VRLADDRRARIPFALLGALLLVGSATFAASLSDPPVRTNRSVDEATDRAAAGATTALRAAVRGAAADAARHPVTRPANTTAGRALNGSTPFRDALRLRIYVAAREAFVGSVVERRSVVAGAALPAADGGDGEATTSELRTAKRRVRIESVGNGSALRVVLRNVTVRAVRDGRTVAAERETLTATVATPVLAAHDRTLEYERRLNRKPVRGPGLGNHLSARLYPITWTRGLAQYGGAPIENVMSNRHVEFAANGGVLATQRNVYGRTDRGARFGYRVATARIAAHELLAGEAVMTNERSGSFVPPPAVKPPRQGTPPTLSTGAEPGPNRTIRVGVNRTADRAYLEVVDGERPTSGPGTELGRVVRGSYRSEAQLETRVRQVRDGSRPARAPPGENWLLVAERRETATAVRSPDAGASTGTETGTELGPGLGRPLGGGERVLERFERTVVERHTVVRTWRQGNRTRRLETTWTDRYRVRAAVVGSYRPGAPATAAERPTRPLFRRGGALDGPNLVGVGDVAERRLVESEGGPDGVARRAVDGSLGATETVVYGDRPDRLRTWVRRDLARLRERVRNVSVEVRSGAVAAGDANPPAALAERLRSRRDALVGAPETYDGVADRTRIAARRVYLDHVLAALDRQAEDQRATNGGVADALARAGLAPTDVRRLLAKRYDRGESADAAVGTGSPGGGVTLVPDGSPGYLTLSSVTDRQVGAIPEGGSYRPLVARNVNYFTVPYGDAADGVLQPLLSGGKRVPLGTAGKTLVAANRTLAERSNASLRRRRTRLRRAVSDGLSPVRRVALATLGRHTGLSREARAETVAAALGRWRGTGQRAVAATNGSLADAVAREVAERGDLSAEEVDALGVRLRVRVEDAASRSAASVSQEPTNRTRAATRAVSHALVEHAVTGMAGNLSDRAVERVAGGRYGSVPAGVPVIPPVAGATYAMANVWRVDVRGSYRRFVVRARSGPPAGSGAALTYVRDGGAVRLDVDDDGSGELLGRSERVSFSTWTVVPIAVPAGGTGVGDVDGVMNESSKGWPRPGCESEPAIGCRRGSNQSEALPGAELTGVGRVCVREGLVGATGGTGRPTANLRVGTGGRGTRRSGVTTVLPAAG